jgi:hypothetical protein|tara:strand:+ start:489 stop:677 length:189 start_codon:yes stop_codon:yes gene_type:complete
MVVSRYVALIHEKRRELYQMYGSKDSSHAWQVIEEINALVAKLHEDNKVRRDIDRILESRCL